jgi:peptidoglycan/xylan/chitin deacetylase (PgdA/CDA1 family)
MTRRTSKRTLWAIAAATLVLALLITGLGVVLRSGGGGPAAEAPSAPSTTAASSPPSRPSGAPPSTASASATSPAGRPPASTTPHTRTPTPSATRTGSTPAPFPPALRGQDVTVLPTGRRVVALTFDAGANAAGLSSILRTLAAEHVPATFFLTGRWAAANPGGVAAIRAGGHRVGNHTMSHPHLPALSDAGVRSEVLGAQRAILAAGADPRPLFRFPFGERTARTIALVNDLGYVAVRWTVDTLGWEGTAGGLSADEVVHRALAALQPGEIVLMHVGSNPDDGTTFDADALPEVIKQMRHAGYGFVTLDALLA